MTGRRHILAIDDSLTIRTLIDRVLGQAGYEIEFAVTGLDGLEKARKRPPDLVLLDYVLPDMRGIDVCTVFASEPALAAIPIVILSAKSEGVRPQFTHLPTVRAFMSKPFAAQELLALVHSILTSSEPTTSTKDEPKPQDKTPKTPAPTFRMPTLEAAAKVLYSRLKDRFAAIPEWSSGRGDQPAGIYFARKILTPEVLQPIMSDLAPIFRDVFRQDDRATETPAARPPKFLAPLRMMSLRSLLEILKERKETGCLTLNEADRVTRIYVEQGRILLATHSNAQSYASAAGREVGDESTPAAAAAIAEQARSGKPVFASLAEQGLFPVEDLGETLNRATGVLMIESLGVADGTLSFESIGTLPGYVQAFGKVQDSSNIHLVQLRQRSEWDRVSKTAVDATVVPRRCEGFSKAIGRLELSDEERPILTLVDGRNTIQVIAERTGRSSSAVSRIVTRFLSMGLLVVDGGKGSDSFVMIVEPDEANVQQAIAEHLVNRKDPVQLINANGEADLVGRVNSLQPRLLIINAASVSRKTVEDLRARPALRKFSIVAIFDDVDREAMDDYVSAGADQALAKPLILEEIDRLLDGTRVREESTADASKQNVPEGVVS